MIFPNNIKCIFCGDELNKDSLYSCCDNCNDNLPFISFSCSRCGLPITEEDSGGCPDCKINNYNFVSSKSVFIYEKEIVKIIYSFKYSGKKYLAKSLARFLVDLYSVSNLSVDYVTSVPMFYKKEKQRGYNQSKLLADEFSKITNIKFLPLCSKVKDIPSQTSLSYKDRKENVKGCFDFNKEYNKDIKNKNILIIDDLLTTGSTASELSKVLLEAGAKECYVLTLARAVVDKN